MSFEAVWGFDPDKASQASTAPETKTDKSTYSAEEQRAARIPSDYTLSFMSSAECIG